MRDVAFDTFLEQAKLENNTTGEFQSERRGDMHQQSLGYQK